MKVSTRNSRALPRFSLKTKFLNNDTFALPGWLPSLLEPLATSDARITGSRLLYPNGRIQHAGLAFDERGPHHIFAGLVADHPCVVEARDWQAVTGASLAISRRDFDSIRGFDEGYLNSFEDVDLCLRLRARDFRIIYTPQALLVHHESVSRQGYYDMIDRMLLLDLWEEVIERGDVHPLGGGEGMPRLRDACERPVLRIVRTRLRAARTVGCPVAGCGC